MRNWENRILSDLCQVFEDGDWIESKDQSAEGVRLIQTGNVGNGIFKDRGEKARYISEATFKRLRCTEIIEGDCLISRLPDPVGRACIIPNAGEKMITAVDCTIIRFHKTKIIPEWFLFYSLSNEYQKQIIKQVTGATRQRISRKNLGLIDIPISSLSEQKRIVAILDKAFSAIDAVKKNVGNNLRNAQELIHSQLEDLFANISDKYGLVKLSDLATDITDGDHLPPPKSQNGIPFITISNINKKSHKIDFSNTFTVSTEYYEKLKTNRKPKSGDLLYTVTGSFGIPVVIDFDLAFCFQRHIGLIRPTSQTDTKWLYYLISSPQVFRQARDGATGTAQKTISLKALRNFVVPKLPLSQQRCIVTKLDELTDKTKNLEIIYQQKLTHLDELKKSLLQKAFNGELT